MSDNDLERTIDQELSKIPAAYQDTFRRTIERDLAETEQNQSDTDLLAYLRKQRDNFKQGGFIRPDGRFGAMTLDAEARYEQALPEMVQSSLGEEDNSSDRRRLLATAGAIVAVFLIILFLAIGKGDQPEATSETAVAGEGTVAPTPVLPEITGAEDSLQTIGNLGGALTIGRPSAIELHYGRTEETIALAIDPSRPTPRGELRYNPAMMLSDNPVAVWLFGTVLNYAIGIPDSLVRNLEPGDRISLGTDTGASLHFVVAQTWQGSNYEAGRLLSQNRLGLTLFALPASEEEDVSFAFANYDVTGEEGQAQVTYGVGRPFPLGEGEEVAVAEVGFSHTADGNLRIVVSGTISNPPPESEQGLTGSIMLSLVSSSEQTTAVPISAGAWQAEFVMPGGGPEAGVSQPLLAEFRSLPGGTLAMVQLGEVPQLLEQLQIEITGAWWDVAGERATLALSIHNPGQGAVYLSPDFIQFPGGDVYEGTGQVIPRLPLLINPGETRGITVSFLPQAVSVQLQIGADLWEVADIPLPPTTGRPPANGGG